MGTSRKRRLVTYLLLVFSSIFLFFLSHPNFLFSKGLSFLAFFILFPVFIVIKKVNVKYSPLLGFLYGSFSYGLFCYWFSTFNPYAIYLGLLVNGVFLAVVFFLLKITSMFVYRAEYLAMALVWCIYEYLKIQSFIGFPYGILAYTQWSNLLLIQAASWGGVWPLSLLLTLSSALCAKAYFLFSGNRKEKVFVKKLLLPLFLFLSYFLFLLISGFFSIKTYESCKKDLVPVICVQNNTDSNKYGLDSCKKDTANLMTLTDAALDLFSASIVVWPETAFVPPIEYNYYERIDSQRYNMVVNLLNFMEDRDVAFVIGNQIHEKKGDSYLDYNGVLVFDRSLDNIIPPNPEVYKKIHLVPFAESFPYEKQFPRIYRALLMGESSLWEGGCEYKVFNIRNLKFSCPVCFEDTFGNLCRQFAKNGAQAFINLSNDSWSKSNVCQMQHLSMAVFRSVENRLPTARSTGSGITCIIDSCGCVKKVSNPFEENFVYGNLELCKSAPAFYTRYGDWFLVFEFIVFILLLISSLFFLILTRGKNITKIEECLK